MRRKEIGEDLMKDNEQYRKLRDASGGRTSPREPPSRQSAGKGGYGRPEYERWTFEELVAHAKRLELPEPEQQSREDLIDALVERELR